MSDHFIKEYQTKSLRALLKDIFLIRKVSATTGGKMVWGIS